MTVEVINSPPIEVTIDDNYQSFNLQIASPETIVLTLENAQGPAGPQGIQGLPGEVTLAGFETLTNKTFGNFTESVFTITDGTSVVLNPNNSPIQIWTLTADRTPTQSGWNSGQCMTLMIDDGAGFTINWTSLSPVWKSGFGTAPTLAANGYTIIVLWKVASVIYASVVGE